MLCVYTDGSCLGNPGRGGWGFVVTNDDEKLFENGGSEKITTNNVMELTAIDEALKYCQEQDIKDEVNIYTDSNYAKQGITSWSKKWRINNWKGSTGGQIKNVEIWKSIINRETELKKLNLKINWFWVKAHSTNKFNNMVDQLARDYANDA